MLEGASVNELDRPRTTDLIPADNADSCHSSADASHGEAVLRDGFFVCWRLRAADSHGGGAINHSPAGIPRSGMLRQADATPVGWSSRWAHVWPVDLGYARATGIRKGGASRVLSRGRCRSTRQTLRRRGR